MNDALPFQQHRTDRNRVADAIKELDRASVFGPAPSNINDLSRNSFKLGRGHGSAQEQERIKITIDLQRGNVSDRVASMGLDDVVLALEMSAGLFRLMKERTAAALQL
jgi:hypothetical protein